MNTTQAQPKALDDTLVVSVDRLEFGKCNTRLKTDIKPKEATFQVMLDALAYILPTRRYSGIWSILPTKLTNQAMLESKAYQRYYAFTSGEKAPKPKYFQKKADSDTSPKKKQVQATKGTRLKSKANVAKPNKKKQPAKKKKVKGLAVLSEVALTEAEQIKLATKRSKKDFHISHASGSGDGVDTQSKISDEQQQKTSGTDEGTDTKPGVPNIPPYESASDKESWGDSEDDGDC
uniref:Uncharacterized protein n=1 Tax=Tanacetum cinerariifolium TaxID=118510 RepID=A0A699GSR8_TANCI|nr:hypothetical protein [Tanacetum cinerariifolium]